ncbi:MAG TPA: GNAT family N-acetyltransferase [Casimicrobiaceae bacterium]|nr:GNAT family N-acetyltransferase [Casimicrobiaceae bacterium]
MNIQRLSPPQASAYRVLMLEAYAAHPDAFTSSVAERAALPLSWWEARLADGPAPREVVLGATDGASLLGVAGLSFEAREKARHKATLFGMYVPAAMRGRGLGRGLAVHALDYARARPGVRVVQLTVTSGNVAAQTLYERCGFVTFGIEPLAVAVDGGFVSKRHMWCDLRAAGESTRRT